MRWSSSTIRRFKLSELRRSWADPRAIEAAVGRTQWWSKEAPSDESVRGVAAHREGHQDGFLNRSQRKARNGAQNMFAR
jgi:hypothetical protein